jgi:molybdate transport system ATP-binding protein
VSGLRARLRKVVHADLQIDVDLALSEGCGVLFGPSGAGKSTILRLIAGLAPAAEGRVTVDGETLLDTAKGVSLALRSRRVGMIFQDDRLFPHLDVYANIGFGLNGWSRANRDERVSEVARLCGVEGLLGRSPATLSGGERQRVGLARAIAPRPKLLLCDEPFSALDREARTELVARLRELLRREALPAVFVTHSAAEALALGTKIWRLEKGRVVDSGECLDVLAREPGARLDSLRNTFLGVVRGHRDEAMETLVELAGGPVVVVPRVGERGATKLWVSISADEIVLARGPHTDLSARNVLVGTVERVVRHGADAEVLVRLGETRWVVSVVSQAVDSLELQEGAAISLVAKARSFRVWPA